MENLLSLNNAEDTCVAPSSSFPRHVIFKVRQRFVASLACGSNEIQTICPQDEWWKKMRAWEEDRGRLITSKQEAERASRSAEEKMTRQLEEVRTPHLTPHWMSRGNRFMFDLIVSAKKLLLNIQTIPIRGCYSLLLSTSPTTHSIFDTLGTYFTVCGRQDIEPY